MEFNAKKCKVLRVARIRSINDRDYCLGGIKLNCVDVEKDLGVLVSHNLSWNDHVDLISTKAQRKLNVLYQTCRDINDISTKKLLFLLGFISALNMLAWYGLPIPNKTLTTIIWNKFNAGLQDSFLEGTIQSRGGGLATAFDPATFRLSMIAPVKISVNHSRTVASMHETGWEQQQKQVRLRSDSTVGSERGGGTWVFLGWVCAAQDFKLASVLKRFPLKLIPRSRICPKVDTPF